MEDYICDRCNGKGYEIEYDSKGKEVNLQDRCLKCHGDGKLNWIDNIFGKEKKFWHKVIENLFVDSKIILKYLEKIKKG